MVAYDSHASLLEQTGQNPSYTHTLGASATCIVILIAWNSDTIAVSSVTVGGQSATRLGGTFNGGSSLDAWYKNSPLTGGQTVQVNFSAAPANADIGSVAVTGSNTGTDPILATNTGGDFVPTVDVPSVGADDIVIGAACANNRTLTTHASQTERWNSSTSVGSAGSHEAGSGTVTHSYTLSLDGGWNCAAVRVIALGILDELQHLGLVVGSPLSPVGWSYVGAGDATRQPHHAPRTKPVPRERGKRTVYVS